MFYCNTSSAYTKFRSSEKVIVLLAVSVEHQSGKCKNLTKGEK